MKPNTRLARNAFPLARAIPRAPWLRLRGLAIALALGSMHCGGSNKPSAAAPPKADQAQHQQQAAQLCSPANSRTSMAPSPAVQKAFGALAKRAAQESHTLGAPAKRMELPPSLQNLDYDAYRTIRFRNEKSLWRGDNRHFEVQFFHVGLHYFEPLRISVLEQDALRNIPFSSDLFTYDGVTPPPPDADLGFSGFRVHAPLNSESYRDEILVFQGASYFRAVARGQVYGLSGRGLAIDTGEPTPEEFPRFTEFVLVEPEPSDTSLWILAYLDSPHAVGAYAFHVTPGDTTQLEVTARIFKRGDVKVFGVAPLTSMFLYGEEAPARFGGDHPNLHRPEAHDSDGLAMWSHDGEWLYRPLQNPPRTQVSTFRLDSPRGFGFLQRDRDPASYNDPEYAYEKRPSAWVEPLGDWGKGSIRLLEIATQLESDDNMGMMWVPEQVPETGLSLCYRIHFGDELPKDLGPTSKVESTRFWNNQPGRTHMAIVFLGPALAEGSSIEANLSAQNHAIENKTIKREGARVQVEFDVLRAPTDSVELRAFLHAGGHTLSETFSYLLPAIP